MALSGLASLIGLLGVLLFAVAIHHKRSFPRWTGVAIIFGTLGSLLVAAFDVVPIIQHLTELLTAVALVMMVLVVLAQFRQRQTGTE